MGDNSCWGQSISTELYHHRDTFSRRVLTLGIFDRLLSRVTPFWVGLDVNEAVQVRGEAQGEADGQQLGGKLFYCGIRLLAKHPVGDGDDFIDQTLVDEFSIGVGFGDFSEDNGLTRVLVLLL